MELIFKDVSFIFSDRKNGRYACKRQSMFSAIFCNFMSLFAWWSNRENRLLWIGWQKGIDNISMKRCVGNRIIENGTNGQKAGMIKFSAESIEEISSIIKDIKRT